MLLEYVGLSQINGSLVILDGVKNASYDEMVVLRLDDGSQRIGRIVMIEGEEYVGLSQINGSLVILDGVKNASYDEMVVLRLDDGSQRIGRIVMIEGEKCVIQVFEGTTGFSLSNTRTTLTGHPMQVDLSPELLGRTLDGLGRPIDGLGAIYPECRRDVNGAPINPVSRVYPRNYICTGISAIDALTTLIRGQKLPIFSGSGMRHNELAGLSPQLHLHRHFRH